MRDERRGETRRGQTEYNVASGGAAHTRAPVVTSQPAPFVNPVRSRLLLIRRIGLGAAAPALALLAACGGGDGAHGAPPHTSLVAAGDVAGCWWRSDEATARLLDHIGGVVVPLGDAVYQDGSTGQFARCYGPTWGRHKARTRPVIGNHDYRTEHGGPYYDYFGAAAGPRDKGWYSYELEGWHVVGLNTETEIGAGSEQLEWLREDLRTHPARCTLVAMHRPRFSSGKHGDSERVKDAFRAMYDGGVDVLLSGHDHLYERFAPQDPDGRADPRRGVRQFVVGTGGAPLYSFRETIHRNSEAHQNDVHGVLRVVFHPDGYDWEFVGVGAAFSDKGHGECH
ncbi:3',5'-cyclic AMP phosphodiesterase CpdA [bacterium JGI 053]|nr:3',5'-cyclic AMP phosphodiesterase CpdA [bacterium JGI 053]